MSGRNADSTGPLRGLVGQTFQSKLCVRHAEEGRVLAGIELDRVVLVSDGQSLEHARRITQIELLCLPGQQTFLDLLRKFFGDRRRHGTLHG